MIRALRDRHRWMTLGMAVLSVGGLGAGVMSRQAIPTMTTLPEPLLQAPKPSAQSIVRQGAALWEGARLSTTVYPDQIVLTPLEALRRPDPLLYWAPTAADLEGPLPEGARLLGAVEESPEQRFPLSQSNGWVYIFSLAHGQIVARMAVGGER